MPRNSPPSVLQVRRGRRSFEERGRSREHDSPFSTNRVPECLSSAALRSIQADPGRLELRVFLERMERFITPKSGFFISPERDVNVGAVVTVDPHASGAQRTRYAMG